MSKRGRNGWQNDRRTIALASTYYSCTIGFIDVYCSRWPARSYEHSWSTQRLILSYLLRCTIRKDLYLTICHYPTHVLIPLINPPTPIVHRPITTFCTYVLICSHSTHVYHTFRPGDNSKFTTFLAFGLTSHSYLASFLARHVCYLVYVAWDFVSSLSLLIRLLSLLPLRLLLWFFNPFSRKIVRIVLVMSLHRSLIQAIIRNWWERPRTVTTRRSQKEW